VSLRIGLEVQPQLGQVLALFAGAGLQTAAVVAAAPSRSAGGELVTTDDGRWLLAPGADLLACCEAGVIDVAVVGKEFLLEGEPDVVELLDLRVAPAELVVAVARERRRGPLRLATRFPKVTRRHFAAAGVQVDAVELTGATPSAPALGLADGVVELDVVLAGSRATGLVVREVVAPCGARLVASRAARALRGDEVAALVARLRGLIEAR
jgi:ATP phosphoribosyltransferase